MRWRSILTLALVGAVAVPAAAWSQDNRSGIAVLPFENGGSYGQDAEVFEALKVGIQQMLMTDFAMNPALRVVDRSTISQLLEEQDLGASGRVDAETAARIGQIVGARYVITGSFIDFYGDFRLDGRIVNVETSEIVRAQKVQDNREGLFALIGQLSEQIMDGPSIPSLPETAREERAARPPVPVEATELYARALYYQERGRGTQATQLLSRLTTEFPGTMDAEVAEVLQQLGT